MTDLAQACQVREADNLAFVLVHQGRVIARGAKPGVAELLATIDRLGPEVRGASLADKVVGRAVAFIVIASGVKAVDTPYASQAAQELLNSRGIEFHAVTLVAQILNRRGDGPCPLEKLTQPFTEPEPALAKLREFFAAKRGVPSGTPI